MNNATQAESFVTLETVRAASSDGGLGDRPICLHSSLRSFGRVDGGASTIVEAFIAEGCTLVVPSFSWEDAAVSPEVDSPRPKRNGTDYDPGRYRATSVLDRGHPYATDSKALDVGSMGQIPAALLERADRVRGIHPLSSFAAVGPLASVLIEGQTYEDVFAPLRELASHRGAVVLAGVGLTTMTLIHVAEQMAGRLMFVRWAKTPTGIVGVRVGGCSSGFEHLAPALAPIERTVLVGSSRWRMFEATQAIAVIRAAILENPQITHCSDPRCLRCQDAIAGGPE